MTRNSVLSSFSFNLLFFIQKETSWRKSLSWFRERQVSGVVNEHRFVSHLHNGDDPGCNSG